MAVELFANLPQTTISSGGTTAPAAGTQETWTAASSSSFPAVSSSATPPTQFHIADVALNSEIISVINISGTTWTVIRGAESTTPVAHSAGFTIYQVASAGALTQLRAVDWLNVVTQFGADNTGTADSTTAIQDAINADAGPVYLPAGKYLVCTGGTSLTWRSGLVILGDFAGTYPGEDTIAGISYLTRAASADCDVIQVPDGTNYGRIADIAIDGNKNNNSSGFGMNIEDGASGQETQIIIERCFFHDNPNSNLYLGNNRRANKVQYGVFNYSGTGDGITVCGSDNLIMSNIIGSNARAGINLGSTVTQNWSSFGSDLNSTTTHVFNNDIYGNDVGIAVPQNATRSMIIGNGIDRNTRQGLTVYNDDCNVISGNAFHSNGQGADNTYAHIDLASGVTAVVLNDNTFGPVDGGVTNLCTYCVDVEAWTNPGIITGNIGQADSISPDTHSGLINSQANTSPAVRLSDAGMLVQGSGNDILNLRNSSATLVTKITNGGSFVHSGGAAEFTNAQNVMGSSTALATTVLSVVGTAAGTQNIATQLASGQTAPIFTALASNGTTVLQQMDYTGAMPGLYLCTPSQYTPASPTSFTTTSNTYAAISSSGINTGSFTAPASGSVVVSASGLMLTINTDGNYLGLALSPHGTTTMAGTQWVAKLSVTSNFFPSVNPQFVVTGLTAGTAYNFDLMYAVSGGTLVTYSAANAASTVLTNSVNNIGSPIIMTVQAT